MKVEHKSPPRSPRHRVTTCSIRGSALNAMTMSGVISFLQLNHVSPTWVTQLRWRLGRFAKSVLPTAIIHTDVSN